jgi:hypothetical protein
VPLIVDAAFEANRAGSLTLEQVWADTPGGEGVTTKQYVFRVGEKEGSLTIKSPTQFGSA